MGESRISKEKFIRTVEEPQHSEGELQKIKEKYNISDKDFEKLRFNFAIQSICEKLELE